MTKDVNYITGNQLRYLRMLIDKPEGVTPAEASRLDKDSKSRMNTHNRLHMLVQKGYADRNGLAFVITEAGSQAYYDFLREHNLSYNGYRQPVAWMWQHDEAGRIGFVDRWQMENGWQAANPRCRVVKALYD